MSCFIYILIDLISILIIFMVDRHVRIFISIPSSEWVLKSVLYEGHFLSEESCFLWSLSICFSDDSHLCMDPDECGPSQEMSASVQQIIDKYSKELNASLRHAGKHHKHGVCRCAEHTLMLSLCRCSELWVPVLVQCASRGGTSTWWRRSSDLRSALFLSAPLPYRLADLK